MIEEDIQLSRKGLMRKTVLAGLAASALLVFIVLPAEYGVDPTGVGAALGLKGLSKEQTAEVIDNPVVEASAGLKTQYHTGYSDALDFVEVVIELEAYGGEAEYKFHMPEGAKLFYTWQTDGGKAYADLHGHTVFEGDDEETVVQYLETQEGTGESGEFQTPFDGEHGWYFLNVEERALAITLKVSGQFREHELIDLSSQQDEFF